MFEMIFYNNRGRIVFGGGKSLSNWRIIEIEGLGLPLKDYETCIYEGVSGQETVNIHTNARTITVKGDFFMNGEYVDEYKNALAVLEKGGMLEIKNRDEKRRIFAYCTEFVPLDRKGMYLPFAMQFVCDDPFFESSMAYDVPVYKIIPMLSSEFVFPGEFSVRVTRRNVELKANVELEPVIIITAGSNPSGNLKIINHTSGEYLELDYEPLSGECITVDVKNRKIYNQDGQNLLNYLTDESFFDGFHLYPGDNDVEVVIGDVNTELEVVLRYNEKFLEAVI